MRVRHLLLAQTGAVTSGHTSFAGMRFARIFDADGSRAVCSIGYDRCVRARGTPTVSGQPARGGLLFVLGTAEPAPTIGFGGGRCRNAVCIGVIVVLLCFLLFQGLR
jgi:hypothetical protein